MSRAATLPTDHEQWHSSAGAVERGTLAQTTHWVGKYRILSELGRGGMSNVYLAVAQGPGGVNKLVVLKAVLPELASEPDALAMFLDEARLAAQLNHPNVVQTYEVGTEGDRHVIVMEYLEGQSFAEILRAAEMSGQRLGLPMFIRILIGALEGLHYAHELAAYDGSPLQLVHRDISPQNVFVTYRGQVKVLDFGIAKASSSSTHTATGVLKGKIAYMAPEQMVAENIDRRADVYSVGCILWAAASGRKLWKDVPDVHIMRRVINGDIPTPQSVNRACDDELNRIVMKALATEPEQRYASAAALQEDLEHYAERFSGPVRPKEIGGYVSTLFATKREELRALVERQLAHPIAEASTSVSALRRDPRGTGSFSSGSLANNSVALSNSAISASSLSARTPTGQSTDGSDPSVVTPVDPASASRRRRWAASLLLLLLLGGTGTFFTMSGGKAPAPAVRAIETAAPTPAPVEAAPRTATVELRAEPLDAQLFLDDQPLPSNPTSKVLPIDGKVHALRAEAPGYTPSVAEFSPARDESLVLKLRKVEAEKPAPGSDPPHQKVRVRSTSAAPKPAEPGPQPEKSARPNCAVPFYVDLSGIKRVRPECL